ncbi:MAG: GntR family transcriptional regulator [Synergistaceae bacterium]|nr:GntR family transcriptional regulator [Synergistaceae bacterium]
MMDLKKEKLANEMKRNPFLVLSNFIFDSLYKDIIKLNIPPGTKLNESKIALELGVSRTPVKHAINQLIKMGLVQKKDEKLSIVSPMGKEESRSLYEARIAVEGYAAYLAARRISEKDLSELNFLVKEYIEIGKNINVQTYAECDHNFHSIIIKASGNDYIQEMYGSIKNRILHYRRYLHYQIDKSSLQPVLTRASRHHQAIYNALFMGFSDVAKSEIESDIGGMLDIFSEWK